jgi:hypothetical protein
MPHAFSNHKHERLQMLVELDVPMFSVFPRDTLAGKSEGTNKPIMIIANSKFTSNSLLPDPCLVYSGDFLHACLGYFEGKTMGRSTFMSRYSVCPEI